jgi:hypothetical protein
MTWLSSLLWNLGFPACPVKFGGPKMTLLCDGVIVKKVRNSNLNCQWLEAALDDADAAQLFL